ncbi:MAG: alkaline phosphatase family protein [Lentihominibacter sp.]
MNKIMIFVIDGCAPEYITETNAPELYKTVTETGFARRIHAQMPSVTNVNHACILSGRLPEDTKVVGNYYYDEQTGEEGFIEERGFMKAETILQRYKKLGGTTALFTVKGKILGVYGEGADIGLSVQTPDNDLIGRLGLDAPPPVNSHGATGWILEAAYECIRKYSPDLMYCTTNDFVFHHFAPGTPEADAQIAYVNDYINRIHELEPDRQIYITADHGMNQKTRLLNFPELASSSGLDIFCLPPLKDRYIENHIYQEGGILYVFLKDPSQEKPFLELAENCPEVEKIMTAEAAANAYGLPSDTIGDYVLFAAAGCAFGEVDGIRLQTNEVRTHGSLYELEIPLLAINPLKTADNYNFSRDIAAAILESI